MSHSQEQVAFAHELKQKLAAVRPKLDDESLAAQFHRAFNERFPGSDVSEELFAAEFEHVPAGVKVVEPNEAEPEKSAEPGE